MNTHPAIVRTAAAVAVGALAAGVGIVGAPPALADPAPGYVENSYVVGLNGEGAGIKTAQQEQLAIKLGYLVCTLDKIGGAQPSAVAEAVLDVAKSHSLCSYVSVNGQPSEAQLREDFGRQAKQALDLNFQQQQSSIDQQILQDPPDIDGDGILNGNDSQPRTYNPIGG